MDVQAGLADDASVVGALPERPGQFADDAQKGAVHGDQAFDQQVELVRQMAAVDAARQVVQQRLEPRGIDEGVGVADGAAWQARDLQQLLSRRRAAERVERAQAANRGMMPCAAPRSC